MGDPPFTIRPIGEPEFAEYWDLLAESFNRKTAAAHREAHRPVIELHRSLAAFDGELMAGIAASYGFDLTVPGGSRPVAGITAVGVRPSHRRRGVLRALMRRQLTDQHEGGEAVAALYASEAQVYGRYGFGCASRRLSMEVRRGEAGYVRGAPADARLRVRSADPHEAWPAMARIYDAELARRPGQFARSGAWWNLRLYSLEREQGTARCVLVEDDQQARGYALFADSASWDADGLADGRLTLVELYALDPAAYAAIWRQVLDRDLIGTVEVHNRPVDDPLLHLLADPRRLRARIADGLWVRVVDVDRALAARSYACDIDVVIEVDDPFCGWNAGRWRLAGDVTGGLCERTLRPADISLPVQVLGAVYLGGVGLAGPAGAGLVRELRAGALDALSRAFTWDPAPWCPMIF